MEALQAAEATGSNYKKDSGGRMRSAGCQERYCDTRLAVLSVVAGLYPSDP